MTRYEELLAKADEYGLKVYDNFCFESSLKAFIIGNGIALSCTLESDTERFATLAEELAHYETSTGNIIDLRDPNNRKQEHRAHDRMILNTIPLRSLVDAVVNLQEESYLGNIAEYLQVTPEMVKESIDLYSRKYSGILIVKDIVISFDPAFHIFRKSEFEEMNGGIYLIPKNDEIPEN